MEEMEMNTDSHERGLERSQNERKWNAKAIGKRHMIQEEVDRELTELTERLNTIMKLL